ncbi:MAG: AMP-binding protein [Roseiarcus sp.]|jgi:long-subunit acyl-CoA synthetase (AMP-forming)
MRMLFDAIRQNAASAGDAVAVGDGRETLTRRDLLCRIAGLAGTLPPQARVVGLFAANGVDWAVAQLACALAGKIVVPLPTFFSPAQLGHIARDSGVELILATPATAPCASPSGAAVRLIEPSRANGETAEPAAGFGQIVYTSGTTGQPKGVRHESGQIVWSAKALAAATGARESDVYLSVLPLPLLLETICAVFAPALVGARVHFETGLAEAVGRGEAAGLADAFEAQRPTTSVLVPELLKSWVGELAQSGRRAPPSLRFVAIGGAPVPAQAAEAAWRLGIPAYEGYGLSECCSVVAVNRIGERRAGAVGRPLDGLAVSIDAGEIVVDGPTVTDGYLGQAPAKRPWRTGDLGAIDDDGFLRVLGRKDNVLVTAFGRNVCPEWIETMLLGDPRVAFCAVVGHGEARLTALLVPSRPGAEWFARATPDDLDDFVRRCCAGAPDYARPRATTVVSLADALQRELLTANGRIRRRQAAEFVKAASARILAPSP